MGGTHSYSSAEQISTSLLDVMSTAVATQNSGVSAGNSISFDNCDVGTAIIDQRTMIKVDTSVLQDVSSSQSVENDLDAQIENIVEAEAPNLNLNPGTQDAVQFSHLVTDLSSTLRQNVAAECGQQSTNVNSFTCTESTLDYLWVQQDQVAEYLFDCTQNVTAVQDAKQSLQAFIDSHTSAETKDVITGILIIIAVIIVLVIIAYVIMKIGSGSTTTDVQTKVVETKIKEIEVPDCSQFLNFEDCERKNNRSETCKWNNSSMNCSRRN